MNHRATGVSRIRELFIQSKNLPAQERKPFLEQACGDDTATLETVLDLLSHETSDSAPLDNISEYLDELRKNNAAELVNQSLGMAPQELRPIVKFPKPEIENFQILEPLGTGGMGVVYLATQLEPIRRTVAIKVIKPGMDTIQVLTRFGREQNALATLSHPGIAAIYEAGSTATGQPYFAMELVRGEPIDLFCRDNDLSNKEKLELIVQLCQAVEHAHSNNILHRDLKPSNVLVTERNNKAIVQVIDFGVAKILADDSDEQTRFTYFSQLIGTPLYMSPEQILGEEELGVECDVYSLGCLLFKLLTGTTPLEASNFSIKSPEKLRTNIEFFEPRRPSLVAASRKLREQIPAELDWVILKALSTRPEHRYASTEEFRTDLSRCLNHQPVHARPPSWHYRIQKLCQRNGKTICLAAALLSIGLLIGNWLTPRTTEVQDLQEAFALKGMLKAFTEDRWDQIRSKDLPRQANGNLLGTRTAPDSEGSNGASLRKFLSLLGAPKPDLAFPHPAVVTGLSAAPVRQLIASACEDTHVRIWDLEQQSLLFDLTEHDDMVTSVRFSPNEELLASGDRDGHICIWSVPEFKLLSKTGERDGGIESLAWSDDSDLVAGGVRYDHVAILDQTGKEIAELNHGNKDRLRYESLCFQAGARRLVLPSGAHELGIFDCDRLEWISHIPLATTGYKPRALSLLNEKDDACILVGKDAAGVLYRMNLNTLEQQSPIPIHASYPKAIAASPDGNYLAASLSDGSVWLARHQNSLQVHRPVGLSLGANSSSVTKLDWIDSKRLATSDKAGYVQVWNVSQIYPSQSIPIPQFGDWVSQGNTISLSHEKANAVVSDNVNAPPHVKTLRSFFLNGKLSHRESSLTKLVLENGTPSRFRMHDLQSATGLLALELNESLCIVNLRERKVLAQVAIHKLRSKPPSTTLQIGALKWAPQSNCLAMLIGSGELRPSNDEQQALIVLEVDLESESFEPKLEKTIGKNSNELMISKDGSCVWINSIVDNQRVVQLHRTESQTTTTFCISDEWSDLALGNQGTLLAVSNVSGLKIVDPQSGAEIKKLPVFDRCECFFTDEDRLLFVSRHNNTWEVWHVPTGELIHAIEQDPLCRRRALLPHPEFGATLVEVFAQPDQSLNLDLLGTEFNAY